MISFKPNIFQPSVNGYYKHTTLPQSNVINIDSVTYKKVNEQPIFYTRNDKIFITTYDQNNNKSEIVATNQEQKNTKKFLGRIVKYTTDDNKTIYYIYYSRSGHFPLFVEPVNPNMPSILFENSQWNRDSTPGNSLSSNSVSSSDSSSSDVIFNKEPISTYTTWKDITLRNNIKTHDLPSSSAESNEDLLSNAKDVFERIIPPNSDLSSSISEFKSTKEEINRDVQQILATTAFECKIESIKFIDTDPTELANNQIFFIRQHLQANKCNDVVDFFDQFLPKTTLKDTDNNFYVGDLDGSPARMILAAIAAGYIMLDENGITNLCDIMQSEYEACKYYNKNKMEDFQNNPEIAQKLKVIWNSMIFNRSNKNLVFIGDILFDRLTPKEYPVPMMPWLIIILQSLGCEFVFGNHDHPKLDLDRCAYRQDIQYQYGAKAKNPDQKVKTNWNALVSKCFKQCSYKKGILATHSGVTITEQKEDRTIPQPLFFSKLSNYSKKESSNKITKIVFAGGEIDISNLNPQNIDIALFIADKINATPIENETNKYTTFRRNPEELSPCLQYLMNYGVKRSISGHEGNSSSTALKGTGKNKDKRSQLDVINSRKNEQYKPVIKIFNLI